MHSALLDATVKSVRQRISEADCPVTKPFSIEWLENAVDDLAKEVERLKSNPINDAQIKHMVDRFLQWKLPENFSPDAGISFKAEFNEHTAHPMKHQPVGTNLFDASQAEAMVRFMLEGLAAG